MRTTILAAVVLAAMPLVAQSSRTTGHDRGNMEHRDRSAKNDTEATNATAREQARHRNELVWTDATRLASLLRDVQVEVTVSERMWRTIANEANTLANRLYARTSRSKAARANALEVRTHVRAMRAAALRGDASSARKHANEATPALYRLIDWAG